MSETLLPCPLCGSEWRWNWSEAPGELVYARCLGLDCNCAVYGLDQQQVIDRINCRTPGPATAELAALIHADLIEAAVGFGRLIPESGFDIRLSPISVEKLRAFVAEIKGQGVPR